MDIDTREYVVIGVPDAAFRHILLPFLHALQSAGHLRVVDLLFVQKQPDGRATARDMRNVSATEQQRYASIADELVGMVTAADIEHLYWMIPPGTLAVIALSEHAWARGLTGAVRKAGGVSLDGSLIAPDILTRISIELAAQTAPRSIDDD